MKLKTIEGKTIDFPGGQYVYGMIKARGNSLEELLSTAEVTVFVEEKDSTSRIVCCLSDVNKAIVEDARKAIIDQLYIEALD